MPMHLRSVLRSAENQPLGDKRLHRRNKTSRASPRRIEMTIPFLRDGSSNRNTPSRSPGVSGDGLKVISRTSLDKKASPAKLESNACVLRLLPRPVAVQRRARSHHRSPDRAQSTLSGSATVSLPSSRMTLPEALTSANICTQRQPLQELAPAYTDISSSFRHPNQKSRATSQRNSFHSTCRLSSSRRKTVSILNTSSNPSIDPIFSDEEDLHASLPHTYSTFFESSSLDKNSPPNLLKPRFVPPEDFFPGDDIDKDIPWIGKISRTYSRKRQFDSSEGLKRPPTCTDDDFSHLEDTPKASEKARTKRIKTRRPPSLPEGFIEWAAWKNSELKEAAEHRLHVE